MDIFKYHNPTAPTKMESGEIINGFTSKMWIERYAESGEFTLEAPLHTEMRSKLPIGSFISHVNSEELMIVENHEINDDGSPDSKIIITGRGFETFLENRAIASNMRTSDGYVGRYTLGADNTWDQVVTLIGNHIYAPLLNDVNDNLPYTYVNAEVYNITGEQSKRDIQVGNVYERVLELLKIDNLGIKAFRPAKWNVFGSWSQVPPQPMEADPPEATTNTIIVIHNGKDLSKSVIFSYDAGDIAAGDYLWSNKNAKNAAFVRGKWVEVRVVKSKKKYDRRMMYIDGTKLDDDMDTKPTGTTYGNIVLDMKRLANEKLKSQSKIVLGKTDINKQVQSHKYRQDYNVGDLVGVRGNYEEFSIMRVSEYVEIEDENGEQGYPTLSIDPVEEV